MQKQHGNLNLSPAIKLDSGDFLQKLRWSVSASLKSHRFEFRNVRKNDRTLHKLVLIHNLCLTKACATYRIPPVILTQCSRQKQIQKVNLS